MLSNRHTDELGRTAFEKHVSYSPLPLLSRCFPKLLRIGKVHGQTTQVKIQHIFNIRTVTCLWLLIGDVLLVLKCILRNT